MDYFQHQSYNNMILLSAKICLIFLVFCDYENHLKVMLLLYVLLKLIMDYPFKLISAFFDHFISLRTPKQQML